ncbi:MAG: 3',5'-cyclic-nucleotide phosphodiesterase [Thermodesulfobacteriota bacterium]|nr:3',5'-cyclic-nucleotide phosphodiesterase [Thermodesulfobacteriota bacterium]
MKIRVLGCYGSQLPDFHTTSFLINRSLLLDAGSVTSILSVDEQNEINTILITHSHLDHIKDIVFIADNIIEKNNTSIKVLGVQETITDIKLHLLNNKLWPDFTSLPSVEQPALRIESIKKKENFYVNGLTVKAIGVNHSVEAVGYIIQDGKSSILYTGDTGPTDEIWEEANRLSNLEAIIVETSFPDHMFSLAKISGHLTPSILKDQLNKLDDYNLPILIFHMKPQHLDEIKSDMERLKNKNINILKQGDVFEV